MNHIKTLFSIVITSMSTACLFSNEVIPLQETHWNTENSAEFVQFEGRDSIHLNGNFPKPGSAVLKDFEFQDGVIEFDMWIVFKKAIFSGFEFRYSKEKGASEYLYFRPGANHQYNAFQYYPHYNHESVWQLYGQHQRKVEIPEGEWFHLKAEVRGNELACYIHNQRHPFFYTEKMESGSSSGSIRFVSSSECYISNLKIHNSEPLKQEWFNPVKKDLPACYLNKWMLSNPIALLKEETSVDLNRFADNQPKLELYAEAQGLINFSRTLKKPSNNSAVLAETKFISTKAQTKKLEIGYSDRVELYLNGKLIFSGNNTYRTKTSKMRSRVHLNNDNVELQLNEGENVIQAIVYEQFGGWGIISRLNSIKNIQKL